MSAKLPSGEYNVIYADPPWTFQTWSDEGKDRSPEKHYDCMSLAGVRALPVPDIAAEDCALFLWVTDPLLIEAFKLIEAWGFAYKTVAFHWAKLNKSAPRLLFTVPDFSLAWATGREQTPNSAFSLRKASRNAFQCRCDGSSSSQGASTQESPTRSPIVSST